MEGDSKQKNRTLVGERGSRRKQYFGQELNGTEWKQLMGLEQDTHDTNISP